MTNKTNPAKERLAWKYESKLLSKHLGSLKYSKLSTAFSELVTNGLDASASTVELTIHRQQMGGISHVEVRDDGKGIPVAVLKDKFITVGSNVIASQSGRFGKFGVGRFAVYRIGTRSEWTTTSKNEDGTFTNVTFVLDSTKTDDFEFAQVQTKEGQCGTTISIFNIDSNEEEAFSDRRVKEELLTQFISYLLAHSDKAIKVNGDKLDPHALTEEEQTVAFEVNMPTGPTKVELKHLLMRKSLSSARFPSQLLFTAKGKFVHSEELGVVAPNNYLALVNCDYLDSVISANRESLISMDSGFAALLEPTREKITEYQETRKANIAKGFLEKARNETYYPFRNVSDNPVEQVEKVVYDVMLEKVHESNNLERLTQKQRSMVFKLLRRAMSNSNLLEVIEEVADLSDSDIDKFKKVLERTTLDAIIKMSDEVTGRLYFLDALHELTYGEISKRLKERAQLHKVLEAHCWLFGNRFHLATSDKNFRSVIQRHRELVGLPKVDDDSLKDLRDSSLIPDLYLAAKREYPTNPKNHHLLVEIKAPSVKIGRKERDQIRRYADVVSESSEFAKDTTSWDLYLVSSEIAPELDKERRQKDRPVGLIYDGADNVRVWIFPWSEIIQKAKEEMTLIRSHLKTKTEELSVSDYLRSEFSFLEPESKPAESA